MIAAKFYGTIYLGGVAILTVTQMARYSGYSDGRLHQSARLSSIPTLIWTLLLTAFIGLRPMSVVFVDMVNYRAFYDVSWGCDFSFRRDAENLLFDNLLTYLAASRQDITLFFVLIAALYFGCMYWACRKMFPRDTFFAYIIYLAAFSTFSYATNGVKAGAAASLFLCALAYSQERWWKSWLFLALSLGFHHSMILPIGAYVVCSVCKNTRLYLALWALCILIAAAHISFFQDLFLSMSDESGAGYLSGSETDGVTNGFRPDFIFYSSFPVVVGCYAVIRNHYRSDLYAFLFHIYLLVNSIWMLCMYASFTNRIAYLSWFMLPIVLIYPFFDQQFVPRQYKKLNLVAGGHLMFTLLMQVVYYAYLK